MKIFKIKYENIQTKIWKYSNWKYENMKIWKAHSFLMRQSLWEYFSYTGIFYYSKMKSHIKLQCQSL